MSTWLIVIIILVEQFYIMCIQLIIPGTTSSTLPAVRKTYKYKNVYNEKGSDDKHTTFSVP